jgi:hypothetical protein
MTKCLKEAEEVQAATAAADEAADEFYRTDADAAVVRANAAFFWANKD